MYLGDYFRARINTQLENVLSPSTVENAVLPKALLTAESGRLILYNQGSADFYLWGSSLDGARDFSVPPVIVPAGGFDYLLTDKLERWALQTIGANGERRVPLDLYLTDLSQKVRSIGKFALLIKMTDGSVSIHAQMFGVEAYQWVEAP